MSFIIQDIATGVYLKHTGTDSIDHPYRDVKTPEAAEQFPSFDHACYAAFWYADFSRQWRVIDTVTGRTFIRHETGGLFKLEREDDDEDDDTPATHRFRWKDRVGCVEAIASELADNGSKYELALRSVRLSDYAFNATRMPVKQKAQLKRDATKRAKDIQHMRESADVGDTVRVPKMVDDPLLGGGEQARRPEAGRSRHHKQVRPGHSLPLHGETCRGRANADRERPHDKGDRPERQPGKGELMRWRT
ncbi:hypothetical protein [Paenibacillus dendritiformis]|uniref:hypothetical protein n=1 Tax=Paenibacillus dendritiformis TaxID=130049 RepID=UPI000DA89777|nr:hypothetical protein [Paenibacillus dendritiformis]PZM64833.1 hypothetical protein DOE73_14840 [Paenibacillus dendritiformis]